MSEPRPAPPAPADQPDGAVAQPALPLPRDSAEPAGEMRHTAGGDARYWDLARCAWVRYPG